MQRGRTSDIKLGNQEEKAIAAMNENKFKITEKIHGAVEAADREQGGGGSVGRLHHVLIRKFPQPHFGMQLLAGIYLVHHRQSLLLQIEIEIEIKRRSSTQFDPIQSQRSKSRTTTTTDQ